MKSPKINSHKLSYHSCEAYFKEYPNQDAFELRRNLILIKHKKHWTNDDKTVIHGHWYSIRLYSTDIIIYLPNGNIRIRYGSNKNKTQLTKTRINECIPEGFLVCQDQSVKLPHPDSEKKWWLVKSWLIKRIDSSMGWKPGTNKDLAECYLPFSFELNITANEIFQSKLSNFKT